MVVTQNDGFNVMELVNDMASKKRILSGYLAQLVIAPYSCARPTDLAFTWPHEYSGHVAMTY